MRDRLADSLRYLFGKVGDALNVDLSASSELVDRVRAAPQSPHVFGAYYDLVLALECDDVAAARDLAGALTRQSSHTGRAIGAIDDRPEPECERYWRLLLPDVDYAEPPDPAVMAQYHRQLDDAFALLDRGFPEMAGEIRALLREIVVAQGPEDPKALTFDGASCYMLWGAILVNARGQKSVLDTAQALAHESGHNLLFGFCVSQSLVDNPDDELFASPLRKDPRPMDGVVHATYVIARMHHTLTRLLQAGVLDSEQSDAARADLAAHRRNFEAGDSIIRESARLTDVGREAMQAAREYMSAAA